MVRAAGVGISVDAKRRKLKLIEAYRFLPLCGSCALGRCEAALSVADDQMSGTLDTAERVMMRVHFAVFWKRPCSHGRRRRFATTSSR